MMQNMKLCRRAFYREGNYGSLIYLKTCELKSEGRCTTTTTRRRRPTLFSLHHSPHQSSLFLLFLHNSPQPPLLVVIANPNKTHMEFEKPYNNQAHWTIWEIFASTSSSERSDKNMPRHKFVPLLKPSSDGVYCYCECCGVLNNSGVLGCIPDDTQATGKYLISFTHLYFIKKYMSILY